MPDRKLPSPMLTGRTIYGPEHEQFRDMCRKFFANEITPNTAQWEEDGIVPKSLWRKAGEVGLLCVTVPEQYGGAGADLLYASIVNEELGYTGQASVTLQVQSDIIAPYILSLGTEEQKSAWLPKVVAGEVIGGLCLTEPGTGSDLRSIKTRAVRDGDHYVINGAKTFITNGQHADLVIVAAKTDPAAGARGISLFLVDTTLPGFARGRNLDKIGQHCGDTSELFFEDLRLPRSALLGEEGKGFVYLMQELPRERLVIGALGTAAARGSLDLTLQYVDERIVFGQKLKQIQNTRFRLAEMETDYRVNQAFIDQCISQYSRGELDAATASMAKYSATEMQCRVADGCLQLFGGYGYTSEYPISRAFVDARVQRIYGGTSEVMKEVIARSLLGRD